MVTGVPVLAIDIGGTKLAAGLVDPEGRLLRQARVPTPADDPWAGLTRLVGELMGSHGLDGLSDGLSGIGVGCGGPMRWPEGEVSPLNIPAWRGFPLRRWLRGMFAGLPVRVHNDAICMAIGEHWRGAGAGARSLLGMVVSTGVGGGLVLDGHLYSGPTGNAGHVGHVPVDPGPDAPLCGCGAHGCLEAVARGPAMVAWAWQRGWEGPDGVALAAAARAGDAVAAAAFVRAGDAVGRVVAGVAALLDLDRVVVGGGIAQAGDLLFDPLNAAFRRHLRVDFGQRTTVERAALGPEAGLIGAAALVLRGERYWQAGADRSD
ncbi:MAG: ROK family protein [Frankiaceae bacterium]